MIDFSKTLGSNNTKNQPIVIYRSKEEAERATGYFVVGTLRVTQRLADAIQRYVWSNGITTFTRENKRKTSSNYYTLKFTLKLYYKDALKDNSTKYGWVERGHHKGSFNSLLKPTVFRRVTNEHGETERFSYPPNPETVAKYEAILEKTPDLNQLYFWICRKYPSEILGMSYSTVMPEYLKEKEFDIDEYSDFYD
jgi:hypothetical protein